MLPIAVGWRWCFWVQLIYSSVLGLAWFIIPETFHTTLIQRKAKRLHLEDNGDFFDDAPKARFRDAMFRPVQMLFQDPGVFLSSLYVSFLFGILYLFFAVGLSYHSGRARIADDMYLHTSQAYPIVFIGRYHMKPGTSSLAFLGIAAGVITSFFTSGYSSKLYNDLKAARGIGNAPFPEGRLPLAIGAAFLVPISLFWFGWSGNQRIHWIVPILSGLP